MNIGFDAKRIVQNHTGLGNYGRYVIEILSLYYPDNQYILFAPKQKKNERLKPLQKQTNVSFVFPFGIDRIIPTIWRTLGIRKDLVNNDIAVFHGLSNELPVGIRYSKVKSVVSIHDLIFLRFPEFYNPVDRLIYRWKFRRACRIADKIIAVSECTKRDIVSFFSVPKEKISVVYQGCHPQFRQTVTEEKKWEVLEKYCLPNRFLLCVGSIESRKNLLLAVKALNRLPDNIHLVAIGKATPYQTEVEAFARQSGVESRLHIRNSLSCSDLPAVYQSANVFIYPSFFEGFGIPVIEALSCGVPVVAATGSCLEEAGGPDSFYVHPDDDRGLAARILEILDSESLANRMKEAGKSYIKRFDDGRVASEIMNIYQSLRLV
jgi:glycosyltransferase involved in cell wall biosynthesis